MKTAILSLCLFITLTISAQKLTLIRTTVFRYFPSASAIECYNNKLCVFGDDATSLMILNSNHHIIRYLELISSKRRRLTKEEKPDIESAALLRRGNNTILLGISSFSTPVRNKISWTSFPLKKNLITIDYAKVKHELNSKGINEINIEGATAVGGEMILANRANTTYTTNLLINISFDKNNIAVIKKVIPVLLPEGKEVKGISGLCYVPEKDMLLFTASVENTPNAYDDGPIGESFMGYVLNFKARLSKDLITPDYMVSLTKELKLKGDNKIESLAVEKISQRSCIIHLAADNDKGNSILYKIKMMF